MSPAPSEPAAQADPSTDQIRNTSDDILAQEFTDAHQRDVRFVGQWNRWLTWEGTKWDFDHRLATYTKARSFLRMVAVAIQDAIVSGIVDALPGDASPAKRGAVADEALGKARNRVKPIQSARTIHNVVSLTRYDKRVASSVDEWDRDPWLLNTPDGTVNLRRGDLRAHRPTDYITRATAVGPKAAVPAKWLEFLRTIMHGDDAMLVYLQKVFGYCLVGETKEHQMYFGYGTGANGKGVTLNTMRGLLGDYGVEAAIETFIVNDGTRHPTELADLRGARLVTCGETDQGQRWAEARIKMLTGGDPVKARFMRQDFFQYQPQFKLFLAGNQKPKLANVDEAIERRFRLIPFTYHVPKDQRDPDLAHKLREEWPAILHWAIEGCLAWQSDGLAPPPAVDSATKGYLSQEDALSGWFSECCSQAEDGFEYCNDLFASWAAWARDNGETVGTKRQLTMHLEDREPVLGIRRGRRSEGIGFVGLTMMRKGKAANV